MPTAAACRLVFRPALLLLLALLGGAVAAAAQPALFATGFEWGDLGDWAGAVPARCDRLDAFGRGLTPAGELHVAPGGSDTAGDGSPGAPFATIGRAAQLAAPGTAIRVHPGTYAGGIYLSDLAGTASAPIWIGGLPGAPRPVIAGGSEGLHLTRGRYLVIHDLEVRGAAANGINADDGSATNDPFASHHLTFHGLSVHDIGSGGNEDCLKLSGVNDFTVAGSEFTRCGGDDSGSGVDMVGCHRGTIARNRFHDLSANAVQAKGGSAEIEIRANRLLDSGVRGFNLGGATGDPWFRPPLSPSAPNAEARDLVVVANLIVGSEAAVAYVGCSGCVVAHNTIVDPQRWILRILQERVSAPVHLRTEPRRGLHEQPVSFARSALHPPEHRSGHRTRHLHLREQPLVRLGRPGAVTARAPVAGDERDLRRRSRPRTRLPDRPRQPLPGTGVTSPWSDGDHDGACFATPPSRGAFEVP